MARTVLVVEDEAKIRELLRSYLEREGFTVLSTASGAEAIGLAIQAQPDLIVLDLRLPDVPGEEVAREVRRSSTVPILMLTAKSAEEDRIRGLEVGADDYVTKPFSPRELILRVQAILRRGTLEMAAGSCRSYGEGELVIDEDRRQVTVRGLAAELTPTEWGVLTAMAAADPDTAEFRRLFTGVPGCEVTGITVTPDRRTMFVNIQHPGNGDPSVTNFPADSTGPVPRDPTIVITRKNGGVVGT
jgi:DNA-binding response OmpR family regulator